MDRAPIELETFHHVYNRGTDKRAIFCDDADRKLFLRFCDILNDQKIISPSRLNIKLLDKQDDGKDKLVHIVAFCLMDNHFHFLLYEFTEGGIAKFMQRLCTAYVRYFNGKYERTGTLFQGPYKNRCITDEVYLMMIVDYIHLNPITHKLHGDKVLSRNIKDLLILDDYIWSSYPNYCGKPLHVEILDKGILNDTVEIPQDYKQWLKNQHDFSGVEEFMLD